MDIMGKFKEKKRLRFENERLRLENTQLKAELRAVKTALELVERLYGRDKREEVAAPMVV